MLCRVLMAGYIPHRTLFAPCVLLIFFFFRFLLLSLVFCLSLFMHYIRFCSVLIRTRRSKSMGYVYISNLRLVLKHGPQGHGRHRDP